jgi:hypothetical protein
MMYILNFLSGRVERTTLDTTFEKAIFFIKGIDNRPLKNNKQIQM